MKKKVYAARLFLYCVFLATLFPAGLSADGAAYPRGELDKVFASSDFGGEDETWGIRFRRQEEKKPDNSQSPDFSFLRQSLKSIREFFGKVLRALMVIIIVAAAAFTVYWLYKTRKRKIPFRGDAASVRGVKQAEPENPELLMEKAALLYSKGHTREAWAACLAAARAAYAKYRGLVFPPEATEYNCLSLVRGAGADADGFAGLVSGWIQTAYAGRLPPAGAFEEALGFCRRVSAKKEGEGA